MSHSAAIFEAKWNIKVVHTTTLALVEGTHETIQSFSKTRQTYGSIATGMRLGSNGLMDDDVQYVRMWILVFGFIEIDQSIMFVAMLVSAGVLNWPNRLLPVSLVRMYVCST